MGAAGVAGSALSVLACQPNTTAQSGGGGGGAGGDRLNFFNWSDYVAPSNVATFERRSGVAVTQDYYATNEELLAKLQAGAAGYDVIVPNDYMVEIMIKSGLLAPLDFARIPNFDNIGENYRNLPYDPENRYGAAYLWGTTGILYNEKEVGGVESWDALWDPELGGRIAMVDDVRETVGAALARRGHSLNATDPEQLDGARRSLIEQKPLLRGYFASTEIWELVAGGDLVLGHSYLGDAVIAMLKNADLNFIRPKPRSTLSTTVLAIPKGAQNPDAAHEFINHMLDPEVGAELSNYTYYPTPNEAARPLVDESLKKLPAYNPPDELFDRLEVVEDIGSATKDYERIFTEVKSA